MLSRFSHDRECRRRVERRTIRLSREPREEREKGLDAAEKQPVMSADSVVAVSSPLGLGRELGLRREDHRRNDLDLLAGDDDDRRVTSGLAAEALLSRTCLSTPANSSSTRWLSIADTSMYLLE